MRDNCIVADAVISLNGNLPANEWISQRIIAANMSAYKNIPIKERVQAQIRFDFHQHGLSASSLRCQCRVRRDARLTGIHVD